MVHALLVILTVLSEKVQQITDHDKSLKPILFTSIFTCWQLSLSVFFILVIVAVFQ